jgi:hypothetical protein
MLTDDRRVGQQEYTRKEDGKLSFQHTFADLRLAISAVLLLNGDVAFSKAK